MDCSILGSSAHGIFWAIILECIPISAPRDLPNPGLLHWVLHWQAGSLPLAQSGKLRTTMLYYAKSLQSYLTLCNLMDVSLLGSSALGILQATILE